MATRYTRTIILVQDSGPNVEVDATGDEIYFIEHGVLGGWQFSITTDDWEELKRFIDQKIGEDIIKSS